MRPYHHTTIAYGILAAGIMLPSVSDAAFVHRRFIPYYVYPDFTATATRMLSALPYDNQVLAQPPKAISMAFSNPVQTEKSYIRVFDRFGMQVNNGQVLGQGMRVYATLPALSPGRYKVKWKIRCQCQERDNITDSYHFTVR